MNRQSRHLATLLAFYFQSSCALLTAGVLPFVTLNKAEYAVGEPIIAKLCLQNDSDTAFSFPNSAPQVPGRSYVLAIKQGREDWRPWRTDMPLNLDLEVYWWQRELMPGKIAPHQGICVIHLLSAARRADDFHLKVVFYKKPVSSRRLRTAPEDILFESQTVSFKVKPLPESEPLRRLMDTNQIAQLTRWIARTHYFGASYDAPNHPDPLRIRIQTTIPNATESVFQEGMLYSTILALSSADAISRGDNAILAGNLASQFLERYPASWLRPLIYTRLFDCYVQQRKYPAALGVAEDAYKLVDIHPLYENIGFSNRVEKVRQRLTK